MTHFDPVARLRAGDASGWPRLNPEFLPAEEVFSAWVRAIERRGERGAPETVRVYTHFSYCEATCDFCMYFHRVPKQTEQYATLVDYLSALVRRFSDRLGRVEASSAYFGGGTPTALPLDELRRYLEAFHGAFRVRGEFTVEGHPKTLDADKLALLADFGVNRLSMGIQSLDKTVLRTITRQNRPLEALHALTENAQRHGMLVNLDLVLGLPGQTIESFQADLEAVTRLGPHLVTMYRYQPVLALPAQPPAHMDYRTALGGKVTERLRKSGYAVLDEIRDDSISVRLGHRDLHERKQGEQYSEFHDDAAQLIGLGPGAYGHVFGYGWFREVTALGALDQRQPVYFGTRVSMLEEVQQLVLSALAQHGDVDLAALERASGVDLDAEFREPLQAAVRAGVARRLGRRLLFLKTPSSKEREQLVDRLAIFRRHKVPPPPTSGPRFEAELVPVLARSPGESPPPDPELVQEWREALGVPDRGGRFCGAVVHSLDDRSIYFSLGGPSRRRLRVFIRRSGSRPHFAEAGPFSIVYSVGNGQATAEETRFLSRLATLMERTFGRESP